MQNNTICLGVDLGGTKTALCLGTMAGEILARRRFPTRVEEGPEAWLANLKVQYEGLSQETSVPRPAALGLSAPGPLNIRERILDAPPNMPGWVKVPIMDQLGDLLGLPVFMNNDANACALAEFYYGAHRGVADLVYLTNSTGMGAGVLSGGALVQGCTDYGGEVGRMTLDIHGPKGPDGSRGSFEVYTGGKNVADRLRARIQAGSVKTRITACAGGDLEAVRFEHLVEAVRAKDPFALACWDEFLERLAQGIGNIIMLYNPSVILLGTITIAHPDLVLPPLRTRLPRYTWPRALAACTIGPATLGTDIGLLSALAVVKSQAPG